MGRRPDLRKIGSLKAISQKRIRPFAFLGELGRDVARSSVYHIPPFAENAKHGAPLFRVARSFKYPTQANGWLEWATRCSVGLRGFEWAIC
jgi:hypothetical protein